MGGNADRNGDLPPDEPGEQDEVTPQEQADEDDGSNGGNGPTPGFNVIDRRFWVLEEKGELAASEFARDNRIVSYH